MTPRRRLVAASALLCAGALLAGCSDDDEDDPQAGPSGTASASSSSSSPSSPSTPSSPTSTSSPTPVGGPVVQLRDVSVQAPEGWTVDQQIGDQEVVFDDNQPESGLIYVDDATALPNEDLEAVARLGLELADSTGHDPRRIDNRTVGGMEGYVVVGSNKAYETYYQWGTRTADNWVRVQFEWVIEPANADQVIEQVLASIRFTG